ncbi:IclR family transcriptional regulator domain-containing protein [Paraburkholderia saeva]|uniref:p-hydroxybenzoate hydroxylase transcriptional activator n=1 Tax=Paraburkholderia saeva TaxID=2777537 RepID=A0A9N8S072_9BURK|nr:IclR family transcriptional regulator C-terminal domain-containing protein [Paraburkholderia saeva]CAG4889153.1 p-hydroxybenzoate hydroxylase transcriptional activator [Paraburkholderia saeva]CAG4914662.1 p-hydroxybenzoate hydroxylase transcriptional activator [Paraburkholderia saeva]
MNDKDRIAGATKALAVIEAFDEDHPRMNPAAVAALTGLTRTAARRYLLTLAEAGYAETDGRLFWLAPRVLRLGTAYFSSARLPRIAQPFLQRITAAVQESALLAVLDGDDVVYVARNGASRVTTVGFVLGSRAAPPLSSAGMIVLAYQPPERVTDFLERYEPKVFTPHTIVDKSRLRAQIDQVLQNGYAMSEEQLEVGMRGVAVPLRNHNGVVIGAISVSMQTGKETGSEALARVLPVLQETAALLRAVV